MCWCWTPPTAKASPPPGTACAHGDVATPRTRRPTLRQHPGRRALMVRLLRSMVVPIALVGMIAAAGDALGRIYSGPLLAQLVAGAAAGAVLLSTAMRRLPQWTVGPASVVGLAAYTLFAVLLSARHAGMPGDLAGVTADALRNGIPRLLTALIPIEPQPDTVVAAVVAAWLAGLAGAELAVRGGRVLLGYAPPAVLFAATLYVVGPNGDPALRAVLGFVALAAAGLAGHARPLAPTKPA